jgi:hypothetical protein
MLVDLRGTYRVLDWLAKQDGLPLIDVEAVMSQVFPILDTYASGRYRERAFLSDLDFITEDIFRLADGRDFEFQYVKVRKHIHQAIMHADWQLRLRKLYVQERLPYDYVQRKHSGYALLRRQPGAFAP